MKIQLMIIFISFYSTFTFSKSNYVLKRSSKYGSSMNKVLSYRIPVKPKFSLSQCVQLKLDIRNSCCFSSISNEDIEKQLNIRTREYSCPSSDKVVTLKCVDSSTDFSKTIEIEDPEGINPFCQHKMERYIKNCINEGNNFSRECIQNPTLESCNEFSETNFCEGKESVSGLGLYLSCEAVENYWWGDRRENNNGEKQVVPAACDPLGDPEDLDLSPVNVFDIDYDENKPPTPMFDDEDNEEIPLSEEEIEEEKLEANVKDQIIKMMRLEIPGSFLRYQANTQYLKNKLKQVSEQDISVDCNINTSGCEINVLTLGANDENNYRSQVEQALNKLNRNKNPNKAALTMSTKTITRGNKKGIEINHINYKSDYKPDKDTFRIVSNWYGKIQVYPIEKAKVNLKDGASIKWVNTHTPLGKNGYATTFKNKIEYFDKARVVTGLNSSSCNFLNNLKINLNSHDKEDLIRTSSLDLVKSRDGDGNIVYDDEGLIVYKDKSQYPTLYNPYACRCDKKTGISAQNDKHRYCIFDPYNKEQDLVIDFTIIREIKDDGDLEKKFVHKIQYSLFKDADINQTLRILKMNRMFKKIGNSRYAEYDSKSRTLKINQLNLRYGTDDQSDFARSLLNRSNNYLNNLTPEEVLTRLQGPSEYFDIDDEEEDNINRIKIQNNLLTSYCIDNPSGDKPQFYLSSNEDDIYSYNELRSNEDLALYFDFTSATLRTQLLEDIKLYGCSNSIVSLITRSEKPSRIIPSVSGLKGEVHIDLGKIAIEEISPGIVTLEFDTNFFAKYEKIKNKKKRDWYWVFQVIWEWLKMVFFKLISAIVSFIGNVVYYLTLPDFWGVDLGETTIHTHHNLSHTKDGLTINEKLSHKLRRISAVQPIVQVNEVQHLRASFPNCSDAGNWSDVDDIGDVFSKFLSGVFCIGDLFINTLEFVFTPFQNFIYGLANYFFEINTILGGKIYSPVLNQMTLQGENNLADMLHFSQKSMFNSNPMNVDNPLAPTSSTATSASGIFGSLCSIPSASAAGPGCAIYTILTSKGEIGSSNITGCHRREGVKTSQFSLKDLNNSSDYERSFDFPHTRYCDEGDMPSTNLDQIFYRRNQIDGESIKNYLSKIREVDRINHPDYPGVLGLYQQCSGFMDIEFKGILELDSSDDDKDKSYIEFIPTLRSKNLLNRVLLCRSSFDCNFENQPFSRRVTLASCSLLSDMWLHQKDILTGTLTTPPYNLLDVLANTEGMNSSISEGIRYKLYQKFAYKKCNIYVGNEKTNCINNTLAAWDPNTFSANNCVDVLSEYLGSDKFSFEYKGKYNIEDLKNETCSESD